MDIEIKAACAAWAKEKLLSPQRQPQLRSGQRCTESRNPMGTNRDDKLAMPQTLVRTITADGSLLGGTRMPLL